MDRQYSVAVATSDKLEQVIILGKGAMRLSARDLKKEIKETSVESKPFIWTTRLPEKTGCLNHVDAELFEYLEDIRLNRTETPDAKRPLLQAASLSSAKKKKKKKKR